jgi:hypothetical protein
MKQNRNLFYLDTFLRMIHVKGATLLILIETVHYSTSFVYYTMT